MDGLSDRVKKDDFSGDFAGADNHGDWIDDWDGIEEGLYKNVPNGGDVAILDIDGAEEKGDAKGKAI